MRSSRGGYRYTFTERRRRKERLWRRARLLSVLVASLCILLIFQPNFLSDRITFPLKTATPAHNSEIATLESGAESLPVEQPDLKIVASDTPSPIDQNFKSDLDQPLQGLATETSKAKSEVAVLASTSLAASPRARMKRVAVAAPQEVLEKEAAFFSKLLAEIGEADLQRGYYSLTDGTRVELSIDPVIQAAANKVLAKYEVPWGAVVAIEPSSGRILALSSHSELDPAGEDVVLRSGMPAASLFKVVTAAAAIEVAGLEEDTEIFYRGGDLTLNRGNYLASSSRDTRKISLGRALAKSCNPAFARLATEYLSADILKSYAEAFAFTTSLSTGLPVKLSSYSPVEDTYQLARTAAGFGKAELGPVHAAAIAGALANGGKLMRPRIIDKVVSASGDVLFETKSELLKRSIRPETAKQLLEMMEATVTSGTARRQFRRSKILKKVRIAAKTGTLSGDSPKGRYHWLIAAAPAEAPEIALAAVVIDPGKAKINGTAVARLVLEEYFNKRGV